MGGWHGARSRSVSRFESVSLVSSVQVRDPPLVFNLIEKWKNMNKKTTILTLRNKKAANEPVVMATSYNAWQSKLSNEAGVDIILVGDSLAMTELGMGGTVGVTMDEMISHTKAVVRGNSTALILGDMPFGSYHQSDELAVRNAERFIEAGADAIKLERAAVSRIRAISDAGILVMGHLGITPQSEASLGGHKSQAKTKEAFDNLLRDAKAVQDAGAAFLLIEGVPNVVGGKIRSELSIPVYGIGAGRDTDGQLLIFHDMVGLFSDFKPKFVKRYVNAAELIKQGLTEYVSEVRNKQFPTEEHFYKTDLTEADLV